MLWGAAVWRAGALAPPAGANGALLPNGYLHFSGSKALGHISSPLRGF
jgi:hypothetical protein